MPCWTSYRRSAGGTIACVPTAGGGVRPSPDPTFMRGVLDLSLRRVDDLPEAELLPSAGVSSAELDIPRLAALVEQLGGHIDAGASGVVVTTGTDTLEEVAFVLDLLWDRDEPVMVVGAMRHGALPGRTDRRISAMDYAWLRTPMRVARVSWWLWAERSITPGRSVSPTLAHWQPSIQRFPDPPDRCRKTPCG